MGNMAVSYTHLDVYKRQVLSPDSEKGIAYTRKAGIMAVQEQKKTGMQMWQSSVWQKRPETVSYTHLDVYKRQGQIARKHNLLFIVDASQTAGVLPINIREMNIDAVSYTHLDVYKRQGQRGYRLRAFRRCYL